MPTFEKELIIISGANGTGKTTFAKEFMNVLGYEIFECR